MAVKIDFGVKQDPQEQSYDDQEKTKIQEAITMIESGESESAIEILKELIAGEDEESKTEESEDSQPMAPKMATKKPMSFRDQIAKSI